MAATLYVIPGSHACRTASLMLDYKGVAYDTVELPTGLHPLLVRARGFAGHRTPIRTVDGGTHRELALLDRLGTVPALRLAGERVQTNREIARRLERAYPEPALFPADPERSAESKRPSSGAMRFCRWPPARVALATAAHGLGAMHRRGAEGRLGALLTRSDALRGPLSRMAGRSFRASPTQRARATRRNPHAARPRRRLDRGRGAVRRSAQRRRLRNRPEPRTAGLSAGARRGARRKARRGADRSAAARSGSGADDRSAPRRRGSATMARSRTPPMSPLEPALHRRARGAARVRARLHRARARAARDAWEDERWFPDEVFPKLAAQGLLGLKYPESYGGQGGDYLHEAVLCEEMARDRLGRHRRGHRRTHQHRHAADLEVRHRGAEAALPRARDRRRADRRARHHRARRRLGRRRDPHARRARRRRLGDQRREDLHHQRRARALHRHRRQDHARPAATTASRSSSSTAARASARPSSRSSAGTPRTPRRSASRTCSSPRRTCSASSTRASS